MARAYSMDLRLRVMAEVDRGTAPAVVAEQFQVTERTIWSWLALCKETSQLSPRQGEVGAPESLAEHREQILQSIRDEPGLTLAQRHAKLRLPGRVSTLWNTVRRWGITLRKSDSCR